MCPSQSGYAGCMKEIEGISAVLAICEIDFYIYTTNLQILYVINIKQSCFSWLVQAN